MGRDTGVEGEMCGSGVDCRCSTRVEWVGTLGWRGRCVTVGWTAGVALGWSG